MNQKNIYARRFTACLCLSLPLVGGVCAQSYPVKPVRWIVAYGAGGPADGLARLVAPKLTELWGQQVVIENRAAANGIVGTELVARAPADGHTLLLVTAGFSINATLYSKLPYDPVRDLAPVGPIAFGPGVLVIHPSVPARNIKELIALAKSKPGALAYGSGGSGAPSHLSVELINIMAGVEIIHVPYKSMAQAITNVIGGEAQITVPTIIAALPHVKSGRLRALGVTSAQRSPAAPELPTIAEAGLAGYQADNWYAAFAPAGTPAAIVAKINDDMRTAVTAPDTKDRLAALGMEVRSLSSPAFATFVQTEIAKWAKVVKASGAKAD